MKNTFLGNTGFVVPRLMLGTATFAGSTELFKKWGQTNLKEAKELVSIMIDYGFGAFDTADCYSLGDSEKILGEALKGYPRDKIFISSKTGMQMSQDPNDIGTSYIKIKKSAEESLKRLQTDYLDLFYLHCYDAKTPHLESLRALNELKKEGKIRYFGVSNYSGWHLMKMLSVADAYNLERPCVHQSYYSLTSRELEYELMPLSKEENIGILAWSPLSGSNLSGKIRRNKLDDKNSRLKTGGAWDVNKEHLFKITDALEIVEEQTKASFAKICLSWALSRPSINGLILGAKTKDQLIENLDAINLTLSSEQIKLLDKASQIKPIYPYWHQRATMPNRDPFIVPFYE